MDIDLIRSAEQFHNRHRRNRIWKKLVSVLCCAVVFCTTYALILPAITMEREPVCGLAEHQHGEGCYTQQEVRHLACRGTGVHTHTAACADGSCGYGDFALHTHDGSCYEGGRLVCNLPEVKAHTHADDCYQIPTWEEPGHTHAGDCYTYEMRVSCGKTETEGHTHTDDCRQQKQVLCCDKSDHSHGTGCYGDDGTLVCMVEEHHHGDACYQTETVLACGKDESEPHKHTDACYAEAKTLICTEQEGPIVRQGDPELVCGRQEIEAHQHSAACFDASGAWICGKLEILSHTHTDACFETATEPVLTCGLEEHTHSDECYPAEETTTETTVETTTETTIETTTETTESTTEATTEEITESTTEATAEPTEQDADDMQSVDSDGTCSFTVYKAGWGGRARKAMFAVRAYSAAGGTKSQTVDLSQFITTVSVQKLVNNVWTNSDTFTEGDSVRVFISYSIDSGVVGTASRVVAYQLPDGVRPIKAESGRVGVNNSTSETVGSYTIDENGLITITFDEGFANNDSFVGSITFIGSVSVSGDENNSTVEFPGEGNVITIEKQEEETGNAHDMAIQKTGVVNSDKTVSYTIEVSTQNGTKENEQITITDIFETNNVAVMGKYVGGIEVKKVSSSGTQTVTTDRYTLSPETPDGQNTFTISGLAPLVAGEKYVVTYTAQPASVNADGSAVLKNVAHANDNSGEKYTWVDTTVSSSWIDKQGWNDANNNLIHWKITINPSKNNLAGWEISDVMTINGVETDLSQVNYKVTDGNWNDVTSTISSLPYTFPADVENTNTYYIEYETPTGTIGEGETISNTAQLKKDSEIYSDTLGITVTHRDYSVSKNSAGTSSSSVSVREYLWNASVMAPAGGITSFDYVDTINDPVSSVEGANVAGKHYAIRSALEAAFRQADGLYLEMENGRKIPYPTDADADISITVTYYSDVGKTTEVEDDSAPVRAFKVSVSAKEGTSITGAKRLVIGNYPTKVEMDSMVIGETWTMSNSGQVGELTSTPETSYTKPKPLEKAVFGKDQYGNTAYTSNSAALDYDEQGGLLKYRLLWKNLDGTNDAVVIKDYLPAGMSLTENGVTALFSTDDGNSTWEREDVWVGSDCYTYDLKNGQKPTFTSEPQEDGTTLLTITIPEGHNLSRNNRSIAVFYEVEFQWENLTKDSVLFTNRAAYREYETSQSVTVNRDIPIVSKDGVQIPQTDENGQPLYDTEGNLMYSNVIEYSIIINPAALDLKDGSDTLTLMDTLTIQDGVQAFLDRESVALYNYSSTAENHRGAPVSTQRYQYVIDQQRHTFQVTLPDELACVLVYRYEVDEGNAGTVTLSNMAELNGESSSVNGMQFQVSSSQAVVLKHGRVTVNKVDSEDYTKGLLGAVFLVEQFVKGENGSWAWTPVVATTTDGETGLSADGTYKTDSNGEILFFKDMNTALPTKSLIRLTETEAPSGYAKDDTKRYFVIYPNTASALSVVKSEMSEALAAAKTMDNFTDDQVAWYKTGTDVSIFVPNTSTSVQVQKVWLDENNHQISTGLPNSIQVQLYQQPMKLECYTVQVQSGRIENGTFCKESEKTIDVGCNSPLIISINNWDQTDMQRYQVTIGESSQPMQYDSTNKIYTYTIDSVSQNMEIRIAYDKSKFDWAQTAFSLSGYSEPRWGVDGDATAVGDPVTLNGDNHWTYTWQDLQQPESGEIYYVVKEVGVPSGYTVTYTNNGIKAGEITISNRKNPSVYELPQTGGHGTMGYTLGGVTLTAGAALWLLCRRKRRREDG